MKNMALIQLIFAIILIICEALITAISIYRGEWAAIGWGIMFLLCLALLRISIKEYKITD